MKKKKNACGANHPHLKGVKCDQKRGHKGWHRCASARYDHWDELTGALFWDKGRGKKQRGTARMVICQAGV